MQRRCHNPLVRALAVLLFAWPAAELRAQQGVPLLTFTSIWRYNDSGTDLGTNWRTRGFNDSAWQSGIPLFGAESTPSVYPYPFNTTFQPFNPNTITYYFRTHFHLPGTNAASVALRATNYVDDGCVIYLNGAEAGRIRMPAGQSSFVTLATSGPSVEGQAEVINLNAAALLPGDNVLAVEVHQNTVGSGDIVLGLSLDAQLPEPLVITNQPLSQTVAVGRAAIFTVGVQGSPVAYQWRRNQMAIPGATLPSYTNLNVQITNGGNYSVVVSNGVGAVASDEAVLTVVPDNQGPRMLNAIVLEEPTRTNRILINWDERLLASTVTPQNATNFQVIMVPSNLQVAVSNVQYNPGSFPLPGVPPAVILTMSTTNWHIGSNYYVNVSRVRDAIGNAIAPNSRVPLAWPINTELMQPDYAWSFHSAAFFEPDIFEQPWYATNYVEGLWWGRAPGPFCAGVVTSMCLGPLQTEIGYQPDPSLFRTTFIAPTNPGFALQLRLDYVVDDAVAFYLNGSEVLRNNLPSAPTPLTSLTKGSSEVNAVCRTNTISVTNLFPGTNWLAAAVFQAGFTADTAFGLHLRMSGFTPGPLPDVPVPRLNIAPEGTNQFRLWWDGPGYALESTTNLALTDPGATGSWLEVTNMANPFIDVLTGERRFFRLRQPEP